MKTYDILDNQGRILAFEIENFSIGRSGFCKIVANIPGARVVKFPKFLSWFREDCFCVFELDGVRFEAEEPYGDNSRYWVGPNGVGVDGKVLEWFPQTEVIKSEFRAF